MLNIAICDDEKVICEMLRQKISVYMKKNHEPFRIECYYNAAQLLQSQYHHQIYILDIDMPDLNGIALAKKLRESGAVCPLIFITALQEYVFDAFEVEALDYICKPIDDNRLCKALDRALRKVHRAGSKTLFIKNVNGCRYVDLDTIYYCEVINRKIYLYTQNGVIDYYCKIGDIEKQLDYRFFKCHRSYLVNLDYLAEYTNGQITLKNGTQIPVARLRQQDLTAAMMQYMKQKGYGN